MAHPSLTVALLRVMQSSSGISNPHACHIRHAVGTHKLSVYGFPRHSNMPCRKSQKEWPRILSNPGPSTREGGSHFLLRATLRALFSLVVCFAFAARACAVLPHCRCFESLLFSYILKALRMNLTAIGASLRPDEFSTDPQLRPQLQYTPKRTKNTGEDTLKSQ